MRNVEVKVKLQAVQRAVNTSQVYVLKATELLSNAAPDYKTLLELLRGSMSLAGHTNQSMDQYRRDLFKPGLNPHMYTLLKEVPADSTLLFGDDLEKRSKELQTTSKAWSALKAKSGGKLGGHPNSSKSPYHPYRKPNSGGFNKHSNLSRTDHRAGNPKYGKSSHKPLRKNNRGQQHQ